MRKIILVILACLTLASAAAIAGSETEETKKPRQVKEKKVSKKSPETKAEEKLRSLLDKLPVRYRFAIKALKLPEPKIEDIVRRYLKHYEDIRSEYDNYRKRKRELEEALENAIRRKNWDKVRQLEKEKNDFCNKHYADKENHFAKLQKQIMSTLNSGQRFLWPALLLAGSAMEPYKDVLTESQIRKINRYCKTKAKKIAKFSLNEMYRAKRKLIEKIEKSILTKEQLKELADIREEKSRRRRNWRKKREKKELEKDKKKPQKESEKKKKDDDDDKKVGGW